MKKQLFLLTCAVSLLAAASAALAQTDDCVVAVYENGILYSCASGIYEDGTVYSSAALPNGEYTVRAFFTSDGTVEIAPDKLTAELPPVSPSVSPEPTPSPSPATTASPIPTASPTATTAPSSSYPSVYPSERAAIDSIVVVDTVSMIDDGGETKYSINGYYQGSKHSFTVDQELKITSAPDIYAEIEGEELTSLKRGDVIMLTARPSGKLYRVDLIMRAFDKDIITSNENYGTSFEYLFTSHGTIASRWGMAYYGDTVKSDGTVYAFGLICDKGKGSLTLANKSGLEEDMLYLDLASDAVVYTYDASERNRITAGKASSLVKSAVISSDLDEDDNITVWEQGRDYNYALVRIVDGTVIEAVTYTGYGE